MYLHVPAHIGLLYDNRTAKRQRHEHCDDRLFMVLRPHATTQSLTVQQSGDSSWAEQGSYSRTSDGVTTHGTISQGLGDQLLR